MFLWFSKTFRKAYCQLSQELRGTALSFSYAVSCWSSLYPSHCSLDADHPILVHVWFYRDLPTIFSECLTTQCLWPQWLFQQHCLTVQCWRYELASRPAGSFSFLSLNKTWAGLSFSCWSIAPHGQGGHV